MSDVIYLKERHDKALKHRHPWIFSGAIDEEKSILDQIEAGSLVKVLDFSGNFLAQAFFSPKSQIRLRVISFVENEAIDLNFFEEKFKKALLLRQSLINKGCNGYRLIASEGDLMPGLIVDIYNNVVVFSITSQGLELRRELIIKALEKLYPNFIIYERSDVASRKKEGLKDRAEMVKGNLADLEDTLFVREYEEIEIPIDVKNGHKTGGYLDQRASRRYLKDLCAKASVLNCFSYTGGFGLWALKGGASKIYNVDVSDHALKIAKLGVVHNHLDPGRCKFIKEDVFKFLRTEVELGHTYDVIVLDPPKFADSKNALKNACRGYQDINRLAFKLLKQGGQLLTFSCSGHMDLNLFQKIVSDAALEANVDARLVNVLRQDSDHLISLNCPESFYLKGLHLVVA